MTDDQARREWAFKQALEAFTVVDRYLANEVHTWRTCFDEYANKAQEWRRQTPSDGKLRLPSDTPPPTLETSGWGSDLNSHAQVARLRKLIDSGARQRVEMLAPGLHRLQKDAQEAERVVFSASQELDLYNRGTEDEFAKALSEAELALERSRAALRTWLGLPD